MLRLMHRFPFKRRVYRTPCVMPCALVRQMKDMQKAEDCEGVECQIGTKGFQNKHDQTQCARVSHPQSRAFHLLLVLYLAVGICPPPLYDLYDLFHYYKSRLIPTHASIYAKTRLNLPNRNYQPLPHRSTIPVAGDATLQR